MVQSVKIFVEIFSRMASNSQKSRKFRPTKYKRYTVLHVHTCIHVHVTDYGTPWKCSQEFQVKGTCPVMVILVPDHLDQQNLAGMKCCPGWESCSVLVLAVTYTALSWSACLLVVGCWLLNNCHLNSWWCLPFCAAVGISPQNLMP